MPYRSELKRPDLKGTFPCSVCGKVFCHSSSLSRHRMQAHFKSYTCTQCNQEISSCSGNETLRSHMFRIHSISRMFMCRCCNWAYPDKTSLHIHMQSMLRNGTPGDVSVLARSSSDGPGMAGVVGEMSPRELEESPSVSPPEACGGDSPQGDQTNVKSSLFGNGLLNGTIFPATLSNTDSLFRFSTKPDNLLTQVNADTSGQNSWLTTWLANNAFTTTPFNSSNLLTVSSSAEGMNLQKEGTATTNGTVKIELKEDEHALNGTDTRGIKSSPNVSPSKTSNSTSSQEYKRSSNGSSLDDLLEKKGLNVVRNHRNKRKASNPQQLRASSTLITTDDDDDEEFVALPRKQNMIDSNIKFVNNGKSVDSVRASTATSRTSLNGVTLVDASTSPIKCCDCTQSAVTALALLQSGGPDAIPAIKKLMENLLQ